MDRVLREYAHTAWTPADPLHGLDHRQRRAILLMPSTFRERFRLAPWIGRDDRLVVIRVIIAERRLMYDLFLNPQPDKPQYERAEPAPEKRHALPAEPPSPFWQYRLDAHHAALSQMADRRHIQDRSDRNTNPDAKKDAERRAALHAIAIERAKLDLRELELIAPKKESSEGDSGGVTGPDRTDQWPEPAPGRREPQRRRDRER